MSRRSTGVGLVSLVPKQRVEVFRNRSWLEAEVESVEGDWVHITFCEQGSLKRKRLHVHDNNVRIPSVISCPHVEVGNQVKVFSSSKHKWVPAEVLEISSSGGIHMIGVSYYLDGKENRKTVPSHSLFITESPSNGEVHADLSIQDTPSPLGEGPINLPIEIEGPIWVGSESPISTENSFSRACQSESSPKFDDKVFQISLPSTMPDVAICRIGFEIKVMQEEGSEAGWLDDDGLPPQKITVCLEAFTGTRCIGYEQWTSIRQWTASLRYNMWDSEELCFYFEYADEHDLPAPVVQCSEWRLRMTGKLPCNVPDVRLYCLGDDILKAGLLGFCQQSPDNKNRLLAETALAAFVRDPLAPRPPWLPSMLPDGHKGQLTISPNLWSLTLKQYKRMMGYIRNTDRYRKIKQSRRSKGKVVTLYDLNDWFIRPWTANAGGSIALLLNPTGLAVQLMASHAWGEDCEELEEALDRYFRTHGLSDNIAVWICTFANYQPKPIEGGYDRGPTVAQQIALDPFAKVIDALSLGEKFAGYGMVAVHTTQVNLYSRLWCPYEMTQAVRKRVQVKMATSRAYEGQLKESYRYYMEFAGGDENDAFEIWPYLRIDTKNAQCSSESDRQMISKKIEDEGGYDRLDKIIFLLRKKIISEVCA